MTTQRRAKLLELVQRNTYASLAAVITVGHWWLVSGKWLTLVRCLIGAIFVLNYCSLKRKNTLELIEILIHQN